MSRQPALTAQPTAQPRLALRRAFATTAVLFAMHGMAAGMSMERVFEVMQRTAGTGGVADADAAQPSFADAAATPARELFEHAGAGAAELRAELSAEIGLIESIAATTATPNLAQPLALRTGTNWQEFAQQDWRFFFKGGWGEQLYPARRQLPAWIERYMLVPVPEAGALPMLACGLALMLAATWRRRNR